MITYQYKCFDCNKVFDIEQSMKDEPIEVCPECEGQLKRVISGGSGVLFKESNTCYSNYSTKIKTRCGKTETCCGASEPCETPPCEN